MNVTECRKTLRSIRRYKADPVDHSIIDSVVLSASFSPFRKNTHVTRCIAIEDKVLLSEIAEKYTPDHNSKIILQSPLMSAATFIKVQCGYERYGAFSAKKKDCRQPREIPVLSHPSGSSGPWSDHINTDKQQDDAGRIPDKEVIYETFNESTGLFRGRA